MLQIILIWLPHLASSLTDHLRIAARPLKEFLCFFALTLTLLYVYVPTLSGTILGDDYLRFSVNHLIRLLFSIDNGSFPLYIPSFEGGQSSAALTLGQLYHPLAWLSVLLPDFWQGNALVNITWLRLVTLSIAQMALYRLFRRLRVDACMAFIASFIAVYNMRMLDCFRFGASLEAYTGFLFTCIALAYAWLFPEKKRILLLLVFTDYWLTCSGHIQMAYYGIVGSLIFMAFCPYICAAMLGGPRPHLHSVIRFCLRTGACLAIALALSAAYLVPFYFDFMRSNCGRVNQPYEFSLEWGDNFLGTLNSLLFPYRSNIYGDFGGSAVFAIVMVIPPLLWAMTGTRGKRLLPGMLWSVCAFVFMVMLGQRTPVHHFVWDYLPFAHSLRTPGRISFFLPMLLAILLLLVWQALTGTNDRKRARQRFLMILGIATGYSAYTACTFFLNPAAEGTAMDLHPDKALTIEITSQLAGIAMLLFAAPWWKKPSSRLWGMLAAACVVMQTAIVLHYGTWAVDPPAIATWAHMEQMARDYPDNDGMPNDNMMGRKDVCQYINTFDLILPSDFDRAWYYHPPLASVHSRFAYMKDLNELAQLLSEVCDNHLLRIEDIRDDTAKAQEKSPPSSPDELPSSVTMTYNSYNRMVFDVQAGGAAFVTIHYAYSEHWQAWVNQQPAALYLANGLFLAVAVPPGKSVVEIRYGSTAQEAGMVISLATLAVLWGILSWYGLRGPKRYASCTAGLLACIALFILWQHSLYHGVSLQGKFRWESNSINY